MSKQLEIPFINRELEHIPVVQRITDGYINATDICKAANKNFADYSRLKNTIEFLDALSADMGIPISELVQQIKGGIPSFQGTWVHPQVAINLAQWASPKFAVFVSKWVFEWMNGNIPNKSKLPYHIQRYLINRSEIPHTHFSVFNEIIFNLIAPLEDIGYELPDKLVPDISQGRMFAGWIRKEKGLEPNDFPTYTHTYPDGRVIPNVKLYPNTLLADFRKHFYDIWIKERATKYFLERDKNALPYLQKVIISLPEPIEIKQIK
ncbi:KilA-N domain-containing protein [Flavobacterium psychrophilum]|uniref:KilA-N domain-containing protein n=1 Tax=Flavobacterium psychrophilum TaxID=96345 RepID=UPI001D067D17|nr:KilA-N domain-containing protein [Flavobacterium psychrophilum]ELI6456118.1 KilA-N domain-containing protein [Flavobacterium psychrophilum]MCB6062668.1 KilA-N domain-containing protein [Flavobacterium psychrophilum]